MWFIGLVIGGLFGAGIGDLLHWDGAWLLFAAIGAIGAVALKSKGAFGDASGTSPLARRIEALEREVRALKAAREQHAPLPASSRVTEASDAAEAPAEPPAPTAAPAIVPSGPETQPLTPAFPPRVSGVPASDESADSHAAAAVRARQREPRVMNASASAEPSWLWQKLFGGNILAKVGVILLFFGIASGLKLAIDFGLFPASVRLLLATIVGIAMIGFGYARTAVQVHRMFGLALQGGGFGVLYLVTYFALARYAMIDHTLAFILFTILGIACLAVAVRLEGEPLAILGVSGAFFAPLLASTGRGSHVVLFSFYAVLTLLVLGVNWLRTWRLLTLTAFVFTLVTGMTWASMRFSPDDFASTEAFLILFALLFSIASVMPALAKRAPRDHWADTVLLFGTPIAAAVSQSWLFDRAGYPYVMLAWSAVGAGLYYSAIAALLHTNTTAQQTRLAHAAIAIAFYTLAVPLAFGVQVTTAFWAIEGFVLAWFGLARERRFPYAAGLLLQVVAGGYFLLDWHAIRLLPVLNDTYLGALIVASCGAATAWKTRSVGVRRLRPDLVQIFSAMSGGWALAWWLGINAAEIARFTPHDHKIALYTALLVATAWAVAMTGKALAWGGARYVALLLSAAALLGAIFDGWSPGTGHALHDSMTFALPFAFASFYVLLRQHERDGLHALLSESHVYALLLAALTLLREALWTAHRLAPTVDLWSYVAWPLIPAFCVLVVIYLDRVGAWPVAAHRAAYLLAGGLALLCIALTAAVFANFGHHGGGAALPYWPFASFFDAAQMVVIFTAYRWAEATQPLTSASNARTARLVPLGLAFVWLSAMAMRVAHHWGGVPFRADALINSGMAQSILSLLWTTLALALMIAATRRLRREQWFVGFALLGVVGAKFVLIDVINKGTVTWTLSLIGVGLLILAASYFSPAPPKAATDAIS